MDPSSRRRAARSNERRLRLRARGVDAARAHETLQIQAFDKIDATPEISLDSPGKMSSLRLPDAAHRPRRGRKTSGKQVYHSMAHLMRVHSSERLLGILSSLATLRHRRDYDERNQKKRLTKTTPRLSVRHPNDGEGFGPTTSEATAGALGFSSPRRHDLLVLPISGNLWITSSEVPRSATGPPRKRISVASFSDIANNERRERKSEARKKKGLTKGKKESRFRLPKRKSLSGNGNSLAL